jgi:thiol-disulfide isomerase/thioredoxin
MNKYFSVFIVFLILISCQKNEKFETNITLLDSVKLTALISENKGNVLVVNVWATWCVPCIEEMPDLIKLTDSYESENIKIIGISIDYPEEIQSKILPFVKKNKINFPVYVNDFKNDEALINFLNTEWSGAIPVTFIYDKEGKQKEFLLGKHSFDEFKSAIEKYL